MFMPMLKHIPLTVFSVLVRSCVSVHAHRPQVMSLVISVCVPMPCVREDIYTNALLI